MLTAGLFGVLVGPALLLTASYVKWVFRDDANKPRGTIAGGYRLGATWLVSVGSVTTTVGAALLVVAGLTAVR